MQLLVLQNRTHIRRPTMTGLAIVYGIAYTISLDVKYKQTSHFTVINRLHQTDRLDTAQFAETASKLDRYAHPHPVGPYKPHCYPANSTNSLTLTQQDFFRK